jgi:hypothetical protein
MGYSGSCGTICEFRPSGWVGPGLWKYLKLDGLRPGPFWEPEQFGPVLADFLGDCERNPEMRNDDCPRI